jgi:peptide/nickel transport system permease protein
VSATDTQPETEEGGTTLFRGAEYAGQWRLMWWRFRRHRIALASLVVLGVIYVVALFAEFVAPVAPDAVSVRHTYAPPQQVRLFLPDGSFQPHVLEYRVRIDRQAARRVFEPDESRPVKLRFLAPAEPYRLLGIIPMQTRLFGPAEPGQPFYLLGADRLGRDMLSRIIHGARVSMSIGLVGVGVSLLLGVILGGASGYYGGTTDDIIQRLIEFLRSIPSIPLWMGLAAAVPQDWSPLTVYFLITVMVSLIGWTDLGRQVRGLLMAIKREDFVLAARLDGASDRRIVLRHMVPAFTSHIIATVTLAIPTMILVETSLSFLGIGLKPPVVSWGVLLQEAQSINTVATAPWLMWPGAAVVVAVLAFNFLGDGLRDAADPYAS